MQDSNATQAAIQRSQEFLDTKLKPDLEDVNAFLSYLEQSRNDYNSLLKNMTLFNRKGSIDEPAHVAGMEATSTILAHVGEGVFVPVEVDPTALIMVSSGLRASPHQWQVESDLYLQLTNAETRVFAKKKVETLGRRVGLAKERLALIQSHADMTSKSIAQLEHLLANPQANLLNNI